VNFGRTFSTKAPDPPENDTHYHGGQAIVWRLFRSSASYRNVIKLIFRCNIYICGFFVEWTQQGVTHAEMHCP
jgi:hypothetical protein